jgi:hypothetical protein
MKLFASISCLGLFLLSCSSIDSESATKGISNESTFNDGNGLNVSFLMMDGTYNTELTAPLDIFHHIKI